MIQRPKTLQVAALAALLSASCLRPDQEARKESPAAPSPTATASAPKAPTPTPGAAPAAPTVAGPLVEVSGEEVLRRLRGARAKATLVNAWASWCGPCKAEFPMLIAMKPKLAELGIDLLFVSVDEPETHEAAQRFASEHGLSGELLVAQRPLGPFKRALNPEWPGMLPATFLFDPAGRLRHFWGGPAFEDEILPVIEGFLAGKPVDGKSLPGLSPGLDFRETPP